jgi:hypothetical protein
MEFRVNKDQLLNMLEDYLLSKDYILVELMFEFLNILDKSEMNFITFSFSEELAEMIQSHVTSKLPVPDHSLELIH